ncbi:hypothetical protein [Parapedobacter sp. 2B3]|uniref:hypothetical protein n=1 Tax=Parapedobacter sp. 2B3 TaxID=3342381 RepID=UPI0035B590BE
MRKIKISFAAFAFAAAVIATVTANGSNLNDDPRPCNDPETECTGTVAQCCKDLPSGDILGFPVND